MNKSKFSARQITYIGLFVSLGVVVNSLRVGSFSFGGLPIIMAGYALGPVLGFLTGAITDIVAFIVRPSAMGGLNPIFTLTSALTGLIPVLVTKLLGEEYPKFSYLKILIGVIVGQFLTSVVLVNIFIDILYAPGTFWIKFGHSLTKQLIQAPIYAFLIKSILEVTTKQINFRDLR